MGIEGFGYQEERVGTHHQAEAGFLGDKAPCQGSFSGRGGTGWKGPE